jgi:hypothetical protein
MTTARQRLGKNVPEVTLSTEGRLKARKVKSEYTSIAEQRLANT